MYKKMPESNVSESELTREKDTTLAFAKLVPDSVQQISANITNMLYNSLLNTRCASQGHQRLDVLLILQKWCTDGGNHFRIDNGNYDCLTNSLIRSISNQCSDPQNDLQLGITTDCEMSKLDITSSIVQYYTKLLTTDNNKLQLLGIVRKLDHNKSGDDSTFDLNYSSTLKHATLYNYLHDLKILNDECCYINTIDILKNTSDYKQLQIIEPRDKSKQKQIDLAYAILNLDKTSNNILLLSEILKKLSSRKKLQPYESAFINYLWQNYEKLGLPLEIPYLLLENFGFIYEKFFISMCTDAIRNSVVSNISISKDVQKVLQLTSNNSRVRCNILNLLYELYACSRYNSKIYNFITLIK